MREAEYNRIKEVLVERKITAKSLAEYLGKSEVTISTWSSNVHQPSIPDLYRIAKFLHVDIRSLLRETTWSSDPAPAILAKEKNIKKRALKKAATKTKKR